MKISELHPMANGFLMQAVKAGFNSNQDNKDRNVGEEASWWFTTLSEMTIEEFEESVQDIQKEMVKYEAISSKKLKQMNGWLDAIRELY